MIPFDVMLFDVGGVLLTNGWDHSQRALVLQRFHLDSAEFEARHARVGTAWQQGEISVADYLSETVFHAPRSFFPDEFFAAICAQSKPQSNGALGILAELAATNQCLLGALNTEARETNEYRFDCFELRKYFQVALSSCYLGLCKPEPEIYRRALDILGRPAERILFIDDRPENVAGAEAAGMKAVRFEGADALRRTLASLGIL